MKDTTAITTITATSEISAIVADYGSKICSKIQEAKEIRYLTNETICSGVEREVRTNQRTQDKGINKKKVVRTECRDYVLTVHGDRLQVTVTHVFDGRNVSNPRPPRGTSDRDKTMSRLGRSRYRIARGRCYSCLLHIGLIDGSTIQWFVPWRPSLRLGLAVFCLSASQRCMLP